MITSCYLRRGGYMLRNSRLVLKLIDTRSKDRLIIEWSGLNLLTLKEKLLYGRFQFSKQPSAQREFMTRARNEIMTLRNEVFFNQVSRWSPIFILLIFHICIFIYTRCFIVDFWKLNRGSYSDGRPWTAWHHVFSANQLKDIVCWRHHQLCE